jgi:HEAT repeat protein
MPLFGPPNVDKLEAKGDVKGLIRTLLRQGKPSDLRVAAAEALGRLGDARAVEPLVEALG